MSTKKVKVKIKKKKLKKKKLIIFLLFIVMITLIVIYALKIPVKNIYINGNDLVSDKEIIKLSKLEEYPPFIKTYLYDIEENIKKNIYIKNINIKRKLPGKIYIEVEEYKPLANYKEKIILSSSTPLTDNTLDTFGMDKNSETSAPTCAVSPSVVCLPQIIISKSFNFFIPWDMV